MIFIFASLRYEEFFTYNFIKNLIVQNTMIGLLAFGMSFVIIAGDIDLSVGSVMALCGVIAAKLSSQNILIVFAVTFGVGIFWGFLNGFMVAKMDIVPFIATLVQWLEFEELFILLLAVSLFRQPDVQRCLRPLDMEN